MRPRNTTSTLAAAEQLRKLENSKKDITHERTDIAGFTLLFKDEDTERKWRLSCFPKRSKFTARFLFMSGLYQALFFMSDITDNNNAIFFKGCWRLACGLACWTLCFLVATMLILPSQILLFYVQLLYGGLSLFLHFLGREQVGSWDFLIVVYGLCFFMLPKISPLNFIHSFMGSSILSLGYIYLSSFWLNMEQWILSTIYLFIISVLFMYISYSSEKSSRERWLLRQRLNREHIDLQMVASSIQGDMAAAARYRADMPAGLARPRPSLAAVPPNASVGREKGVLSQEEKMNNFFKGIAAWAICMSMGYAFQVLGADAEPAGVKSNSKAFALLMHSMGFSIFLLYFTGQMRWFIINGVVGMLMLWIFNETGLDNRWAVISTHSIGYFILTLVVVSSILVFGGVVLVWTHLIDFLMNILNRYPEVKEEIRQEKILESVLVRYLAEMPRPTVLHRPISLAEEEAGMESRMLDQCEQTYDDQYQLATHSEIEDLDNYGPPRVLSDSCTALAQKKLSRVLQAKKPNCCFFCSKNEPLYLLPACAGWTPRDHCDNGVLPMCTPYTELAHARDSLNTKLNELSRKDHELEEANQLLKKRLEAIEEAYTKQKVDDDVIILAMQKKLDDSNRRLTEEIQRREKDINDIISQHNTQLSDIKRLYKTLQARQKVFLVQHQASLSLLNNATGGVSDDSEAFGPKIELNSLKEQSRRQSTTLSSSLNRTEKNKDSSPTANSKGAGVKDIEQRILLDKDSVGINEDFDQ